MGDREIYGWVNAEIHYYTSHRTSAHHTGCGSPIATATTATARASSILVGPTATTARNAVTAPQYAATSATVSLVV